MALVTLPQNYLIVAGKGESEYALNAFDMALLDAGVGNLNLIRVSSILTPGAKEVKSHSFSPGELISIAYAQKSSYIKGEIIAAAVSVAIPQDKKLNGLIMEHSGAGTAHEIEEIVRKKAELGMKYRNFKLKKIKSIAIEHTVENIGAVFAGVVIF
ncbi:MAG: arginine decarboxylase, pyruvoyl-dependent [Spirochaetes bacterium]|nr:arginine decarboxylase, pyruvoyl-dependent [Spirochaetota bacterium]